MKQLSKKQQQIFDYIVECTSSHGYPPSVREIGAAVGLKSPSTVHLHLNSLEKAGYIMRDSGKTRAITLADGIVPEGIPVLGTVAAGEPILAVEDAIGYIQYDTESSGEFFALKIKGESMKYAGILDGDMVIVRRQNTANNGEIIIALLGDEATCKRLRRDGGAVWLMPENPDFNPINGSSAQILGRVTAVIRKY